MGKAVVRYINIGEAIEKLSTWGIWWGSGRFWGSPRNVECLNGLVRSNKRQDGEVKYVKSPVQSNDFWFRDLLGECCQGNQKWMTYHFLIWESPSAGFGVRGAFGI